MAGQHARFSPSSSHRVATCPASLLRVEALAERPTVSFEAVEGTIAHEIHYRVLSRGHDPHRYVGQPPEALIAADRWDPEEWKAIPPGWTVPAEMAVYVEESADWCSALPGYHFVEQRLSISRWTPIPDQFGTSDHVAIDFDARLLVVTDLKYGKGVKVFAEKNTQLALYALGALDEFEPFGEIERVLVRISQPRLDHRDVWETTPAELYEMGAWLRERFTLALKPDAPFGPDKHACQFCPLKSACPALYERTRALSHGWFDDLAAEMPNPEPSAEWPLSAPAATTLTPEQIALVLDHADLVSGFIEDVRKMAVHRLLHNQEVPGYKIVEGRSNRRWLDEEAARVFLEERKIPAFKAPQIISPAEAEKALPKAERKNLASLVVKPEGKPTLALVSDKRPAFIPATAEDMFEVEPDSSNL